MARMKGVWMHINNPDRTAQEDLNLSVGGVISLAKKDLPGGLWTVRIKVMDDDTFDDDVVFSNSSFQRGVYDLNPTSFSTGVIVPANRVINSEPGYESCAEIYCRVSASLGNKSTNWSNTNVEDVLI